MVKICSFVISLSARGPGETTGESVPVARGRYYTLVPDFWQERVGNKPGILLGGTLQGCTGQNPGAGQGRAPGAVPVAQTCT